jgi:hypothetical protein
MSNTAFGVAQTSAGVGTTDTDMRHILAAQWDSTGVINGLSVTGTTSLYYSVAAGTAVCSKGPSDGKTLAYFAGGLTATVAANSSGNPRIDSVYIYSNDANQGDADNLVHIGVTQGTAAATPTAPSIPTYATLLAQMVMPAGATTTANAHHAASVGYAIPYGASLGVLADTTNKMDAVGDSTVNKFFVEQTTALRYLPTDRLVELRFQVCASASSGYSDWYQSFMVDGAEVANSGGEFHFTEGWTTQERSHVMEVPKGNHTIAVRTGLRNGSAPIFHYSGDSHTSFYGRRLQAFDRGVVR